MGYYVNIVGFHGTNSTAANTIIREKRFIAKEKKPLARSRNLLF